MAKKVMGRTPATGEAIKVPAKKVIKFQVSPGAKDPMTPQKSKRARKLRKEK